MKKVPFPTSAASVICSTVVEENPCRANRRKAASRIRVRISARRRALRLPCFCFTTPPAEVPAPVLGLTDDYCSCMTLGHTARLVKQNVFQSLEQNVPRPLQADAAGTTSLPQETMIHFWERQLAGVGRAFPQRLTLPAPGAKLDRCHVAHFFRRTPSRALGPVRLSSGCTLWGLPCSMIGRLSGSRRGGSVRPNQPSRPSTRKLPTRSRGPS